jgi:serpin B
MGDKPAPAATVPAVAAADDAFGADMYQVLTEDRSDVVFSPASVASALRMALCGARGRTASELASALHLNGSPEAAADGWRALSAVLRNVTAGGSVTFRAPNILWVQSGLPLLPDFTARLTDAAAAAVADADFAGAPAAAREEINRVIAEQTAGKITGLLQPRAVDAATRLVLTSAIYLKAAWAEPFPETATRDEPFYPDGPDHPSLTVPMMRGIAARAYLRGDGYQAVVLPYRGSSLAMAVVLPDGPLAALRPKVAASGLRGMLAGTARHQVTLSLPRFRLETAVNLVPALRRLGVTEAFTEDADFSGITTAERLRIGVVAHQAYVDVDEQGTEAAAATAITFRPTAAFRPPPPVTVVVDRPFLFAVVDNATGLPLFLGQVSHPPRAVTGLYVYRGTRDDRRRSLAQSQLPTGTHQHLRQFGHLGSLAACLGFGLIGGAESADRGDGVAFARRHGQFLGVLEQVLPPPPTAEPGSLNRPGGGALQFVHVLRDADGLDEGLATLHVILLPRLAFQLGVVQRPFAAGAADELDGPPTSPRGHRPRPGVLHDRATASAREP